MNVIINFKDKKHSSGCIRGEQIILSISSRLSREQQQIHIDELTKKLLKNDQKQGTVGEPSGIITDQDLTVLARSINDKYYRLPMAYIRFKKQESRWGSCSTRTRQIYISHRMINAPLEMLEYLIIHELCHLKEANHGKNFWALVAVGCPDYKKRRRTLKNFNPL